MAKSAPRRILLNCLLDAALAALALAEACDVCPVTGAVGNADGFPTFKQLHEAVAGADAGAWRACVRLCVCARAQPAGHFVRL